MSIDVNGFKPDLNSFLGIYGSQIKNIKSLELKSPYATATARLAEKFSCKNDIL